VSFFLCQCMAQVYNFICQSDDKTKTFAQSMTQSPHVSTCSRSLFDKFVVLLGKKSWKSIFFSFVQFYARSWEKIASTSRERELEIDRVSLALERRTFHGAIHSRVINNPSNTSYQQGK
jgi:hypothetical protein